MRESKKLANAAERVSVILTVVLVALEASVLSNTSYHRGIKKEPLVALMSGPGPKICAYSAIVIFFVLVALGTMNKSFRLLTALGTGWLVLYLFFEQFMAFPQNRLWLVLLGSIMAYIAAAFAAMRLAMDSDAAGTARTHLRHAA